MAEALTAEVAREWFDYNAETGLIVWKRKPKAKVRMGDVVGNLNRHGYRCLKFKGQQYLAHRLAWLLQTGSWPEGDIDHMNGNRSDNRFVNLRDVPRAENTQNTRAAKSSNKSSGLLGVSRKGETRWVSSIWAKGRRHHLGTFNTPEEAHAMYLKKKRELHPGCLI